MASTYERNYNPAIINSGLKYKISDLSSDGASSGNVITFNGTAVVWGSGSASGVTSFNTLTGAVTISAGSGITLTPAGNNIAIAATGAVPANPDTSIQFNNAGAFGGDAAFTFDPTDETVLLTGTDIFVPTAGSVVFGAGAGNHTMTGIDNVLIGGKDDGFANVGLSLTTGDENIFIGKGTGRLMTAASRNVIIGSNAGSGTGSGGLISDNVIIGRGAGTGLGLSAAGDGNVLIGVGTGTGINANYNIAIGYQAMGFSTGTGNIALGFAALAATTSGLNIGIGDSVGQNITTGTANILIGSLAGNQLATTASNNTIIGYQAGTNNEGNRNTFLGAYAGYVPLGSDNVAVGYNSFNAGGSGLDQTISFSTVLGSEAMEDPRTGSDYTTAIGYKALFGLTAGAYNTAIGANAGAALTLGIENTFVGMSAGAAMTGAQAITTGNFIGGMYASVNRTQGNFNTIIGTRTDQAASTGDGNTILGWNSGAALTSGASNVMIGVSTGTSITTGQGIFLGAGADGVNNGVGQIAIGFSAVTTASNQMVVGSSSTPINDYYFGEGVTSASPSDITFNASGGDGNNVAGADFTVSGGKATGNAIGGDLASQTSVPGTSGSTLQTSGDRYRILAKYFTLTESADTGFMRISVPASTVAGGSFTYTVEANDATDFQSLSGVVTWDAVNKAGTITVTMTDVQNANEAASAGTLAVTITAIDAGADLVTFRANAVSSLTQTVLRINAQVTKNFGTGAISSL